MNATLYVRGGLDPALADTTALDAEVRALLRDGAAADAADLLHGWATHRTYDPPAPVIWHRQLGTTAVRVGTEAA